MIPDFDHNNVLPPHMGNPVARKDLSPYECTTVELCRKFGTTPARVDILRGLLAFRERMTNHGIISGFQWLNGSFTENIEASELRAPRDLDLVTFYGNIPMEDQNIWIVDFAEFTDSDLSREAYLLDHYAVDYTFHPDITVEQTRYWLQLFSHNRLNVWKGILKVGLNTPQEDAQVY